MKLDEIRQHPLQQEQQQDKQQQQQVQEQQPIPNGETLQLPKQLQHQQHELQKLQQQNSSNEQSKQNVQHHPLLPPQAPSLNYIQQCQQQKKHQQQQPPRYNNTNTDTVINDRSSHRRCSIKNLFLKISQF